jgi:EAL domain-containing protein (putative c-di-GMP-specific phosphodiesterase class I)
MGRSLNLRVIAEGVQTREELIFLQEHHCDEAQGFYFSEPVPPAQFVRLFEDDAFPEALQQCRRQANRGDGRRVKSRSVG